MADASTGPLMNQPTLVDRAPLSFSLLSLSRTFHSYGSEMLLKLGLYPGQELILMRLFDRDEQIQTALQTSIGLDHSTVSRSIRRMEDAGLVTRRPADHDKRAMVVSLTDAGRAMHPRLVELWGTLEATLTDGLSDGERTTLLKTIGALDQSVTSARRRSKT
ncbi:MarR family winged helix-turn-helix transcriptional regulator [Actinoplanes friuliensis]|uniref:MarR family transcriptional regulator n=1 Tax=Actinoplanes friuliensis DSM 7358 TaxID=1246995 RepID=U5VY66_9ACTN|nr:MarR family transcriptional regulator [Actinoplanes friuliensis]AGZ40650.1 MarR family transcriptional regulator [Actinoplanes friuliensis DSM 7358]